MIGKTAKRLLVLGLALVLALSVCMMTAFAAGTEYDVGTGSRYSSVIAAVNAAANSGVTEYTIKLTSDVTESSSSSGNDFRIESDMDVTLDLNGHTYAGLKTENDAVITVGGGTFTLTDSSASGNGVLTGAESAGATHAVRILSGGVFTMEGGTISLTGSSTGRGAGVHVDNGSFVMNGGTIEDCSCQNGAAVGVYGPSSTPTKATFTMNGGTITGNTATNDGGGVYVMYGCVTINGGEISGNAAYYAGGGVYIGSKGTITMTGGTISDNTQHPDETDITGLGGGGVFLVGSTFDFYGGTISGNAEGDGHGGGVFVSANATLNMLAGEVDGVSYTGGTISNNTAANDGGGVYVNTNGTLNLEAGTISENAADGTDDGVGGGVAAADGASFTMTGGEVSQNTAEVAGGGIYFYGNAKTAISGGTISGNTAYNGGGVYLAGTGDELILSDSAVISNNTADRYGGGVYLAATSSAEEDGTSNSFQMNGGTISGNSASINCGGGVYVAANGTFTLTDGVITGNKAVQSSSGRGGGVSVDSGSFVMSGGTLSENNASYGGGFYVTNGTTTIENGTITGNTAEDYGGGGEVTGTSMDEPESFVLSGGTISQNTASYGGGIAAENVTLLLTGGIITSNTASTNGGGLLIHTGTTSGYQADLEMTGGSIVNNNCTSTQLGAAGYGGGIYAYNSTTGYGSVVSGIVLNITGGTIANNTTTVGGGGIAIKAQSTLNVGGDVKISNNKVLNGNGGGLHVDNPASMSSGTFTMNGGEITGNSASADGGGVYITYLDSFTMEDGTIAGNTAAGNGGGVYVYYNDSFSMEGGEITGNTAENGGGLYLGSYSSGNGDICTVSGGTITGNVARASEETGGNGGGVYVAGSDAFAMTSGALYGNLADTAGADVYAEENEDLTLPDSSVINENVDSFDGWYVDSAEARYAKTSNPEKVENIEDLQVAEYLIAAYSVKVTLDPNGGVSGEETAVSGKANGIDPITVTLSEDCTPTRDGYNFAGWATASDAEEAEYEEGGSFETLYNATLYAVWTESENPKEPETIHIYNNMDLASNLTYNFLISKEDVSADDIGNYTLVITKTTVYTGGSLPEDPYTLETETGKLNFVDGDVYADENPDNDFYRGYWIVSYSDFDAYEYESTMIGTLYRGEEEVACEQSYDSIDLYLAGLQVAQDDYVPNGDVVAMAKAVQAYGAAAKEYFTDSNNISVNKTQ